jgi:hypothetical protein
LLTGISRAGEAALALVSGTPSALRGPGGDVAKGIAIGVVRVPAVAIGNTLDTAADIGAYGGEFLSDQLRGTSLEKPIRKGARAILNAPGFKQAEQLINSFDADDSGDPDFGFVLGGSDFGFDRVGNDLANDFTAQAGAFLTGYGAVRSLATRGVPIARNVFKSPSLIKRVGAEVVAGGIADLTVVTAQERNLSGVLKDHGVLPEFLDFMAIDDDDGRLEQKFKGALEGAFIGAGLEFVGDGLLLASKAYKKLRQGKVVEADSLIAQAKEKLGAPADTGTKKIKTSAVDGGKANPDQALKDKLDRSFARQRTLAKAALNRRARAAGVALPTEEVPGAAATKVPKEGEPTRTLPRAAKEAETAAKNIRPVSKETLVTDANNALQVAGVNERLTVEGLSVSADGKFIVSIDAQHKLQDMGMADAFTTAREGVTGPNTIVFRGQDSKGEVRVAGAMTRENFAEFGARVKALATLAKEAEGFDDAGRVLKNVVDIKKGKKGQFTFSHAGSTVDAAVAMRAIVDSLPDSIKSVVSDKAMSNAVAQLRRSIGGDDETILAFAQSIAASPDQQAVAMLVTRVFFEDASAAVDDVAKLDWFTASPEAVEQALEQVHQYTVLAALFSQHKSAAGRTLRALQIPNRDIYKATFGLDKSVRAGPDEFPLPRNRQELADWTRIWKALGNNPEGRLDWVFRKTFKLQSGFGRTRNAIANFWTMSILMAVRTVDLNVIGPALVGGLRTFEKSSGAVLQAIAPVAKSTGQRIELLNEARDAARSYASLGFQTTSFFSKALFNALSGNPMLAGLDDNLAATAGRFASRSFKENKVLTGARNSAFDFENRFQAVNEDVLEASGQTGAFNKGLHILANYINVLPRVFSRVNASLDDFTSRLSAIGEAQADGYRLAREQDIPDGQVHRFVMDHIGSQFDELGGISDREFKRRALRTTLTDQVGTTLKSGDESLGKTAGNTINKIRRNFPETRFIIPIFSITANGLGEGLRRIPGANLLLQRHMRELSGEFGKTAENEAYGRMLSGAALTLIGLQMARSGRLTGSGPDDPADQAAWQAKYRKWSMRIGDQWVDYSRFDILNVTLAVPAAIYDSTVYRAQDKEAGEKAILGVAAIAEMMRDRSALQTLSDFASIGDQGEGRTISNVNRFFNGLVSGFVPNFIPTLFTDPLDPVLREASNPWEAVLKKLPFASTTLDPIFDTFGNPVYKPRDTLLEGVLPITLTDDVSWQENPVSNEIHRLYESTGYGAGLRRADHLDDGEFKSEQVNLEDGSSMFSTYMRMRRTTRIKGRTLEESVGALIASPRYARAVDAGPDARPQGRQESRGKLIGDIFTDFNSEIRTQLARQSPIARRRLALTRAKRDDTGSLATHSVDELAENEDLLNALGINIQAYERKVTGR